MILSGLAATISASFLKIIIIFKALCMGRQSNPVCNTKTKQSLKGKNLLALPTFFPSQWTSPFFPRVLHQAFASLFLLPNRSLQSRVTGVSDKSSSLTFQPAFSKSRQTTLKEPTKQFTFNPNANYVWMIIYP